MWGPIPNSSASTVISIVISLGKQGTLSPLPNKRLRKKVTIGQNERSKKKCFSNALGYTLVVLEVL